MSARRLALIGLFGLLGVLSVFLRQILERPPGPSPEQVLKQSRQTIQHAEQVMEEIQRQQPELDRQLKELREGPPSDPIELK